MRNLLLILPLILPFSVSCKSSTDNGQGVHLIEEMNETEYNKWKLYIELLTQTGIERLVDSKKVTQEELDKAATAIDGLLTATIDINATSILVPALEKAGFKNTEAKLLLTIVEQELLANGALSVSPLGEISPRSKELLATIAKVLRAE